MKVIVFFFILIKIILIISVSCISMEEIKNEILPNRLKSLPPGKFISGVQNRFSCLDISYYSSKKIDLLKWNCEEIKEFIIPDKRNTDCKDSTIEIVVTVTEPTLNQKGEVENRKIHQKGFLTQYSGPIESTKKISKNCLFYSRYLRLEFYIFRILK